MEVTVSNRQEKVRIDPDRVTEKAKKILNALGFNDSELSVVLVDDEEIAALNSEYRGKQGPTNVLSFPMMEGEFKDLNPAGLLGDVVLSLETVEREAAENEYTTIEMFDFYLIHGILHLLGYDHVESEEDAIRMENKTKEIWELLGR